MGRYLLTRAMTRGWIYFIRCPSNGLIKIGWSLKHPDKRLEGIRTMSPVELEPIGAMRGQRTRESYLHYDFAHLRAHGEWFRPGEDLLAFISRRVRPWPNPSRTVIKNRANRVALMEKKGRREYARLLLSRYERPEPEDRSDWRPELLAQIKAANEEEAYWEEPLA